MRVCEVMSTYDHAEGRVEDEVSQCATDHCVFVVVLGPFQARDTDHEALHEGDRERVGVHEHGSCHCEISMQRVSGSIGMATRAKYLCDLLRPTKHERPYATSMDTRVTMIKKMGTIHSSRSFSRSGSATRIVFPEA